MAQERIFEQNGAGAAFKAVAQPYKPRGHIYELPLEQDMKATFTRSGSLLNNATKGTWQDVKIATPNGTFQFENEAALKQRTEALAKNEHPYAPAFQKVLQTYQNLNRTAPRAQAQPRKLH